MKKKIQKLFMCKLCLCAFLLLIFSACSTKTKDVSEYSVINLRDVIDKEAKVNLADEIADVKYVPLQVTSDDESLIGEIADYAVTSKYIYILSVEESRVIQFDRNGNFIKTIIKSGPGPQEFVGLLSGMQADEENNKLYLFGNMIWVYSLEGEFIEKAFRLIRDKWVFTNKRLIMLNVQGITGSKREYHSIPYKSIAHFSIETGGTFDDDCEMKIWISGQSEPFLQEFKKGTDLKSIQKLLVKHIFQ